MKKLVLFISGLFLFGCASSNYVNRVVLPSGDRGYSISCADSKNLNQCYEMAGEICTYGYDIVNQEAQSGYTSGALGYTGANALGITGAASSKSTWQKGPLIKCKQQEILDSENLAAKQAADERQTKSLKRAPYIVGGVLVVFGIMILFHNESVVISALTEDLELA